MPGINGIDVLKRLREVPRTASIPVIMMSGVDATDSIVRSIEAGADEYVMKPFDRDTLQSKLQIVGVA